MNTPTKAITSTGIEPKANTREIVEINGIKELPNPVNKESILKESVKIKV